MLWDAFFPIRCDTRPVTAEGPSRWYREGTSGWVVEAVAEVVEAEVAGPRRPPAQLESPSPLVMP